MRLPGGKSSGAPTCVPSERRCRDARCAAAGGVLHDRAHERVSSCCATCFLPAEQTFSTGGTKRLERALAAGLGLGEDGTEHGMRSEWIEMAAARQRRRHIVPLRDRPPQVLETAVVGAHLALEPSFQAE